MFGPQGEIVIQRLPPPGLFRVPPFDPFKGRCDLTVSNIFAADEFMWKCGDFDDSFHKRVQMRGGVTDVTVAVNRPKGDGYGILFLSIVVFTDSSFPFSRTWELVETMNVLQAFNRAYPYSHNTVNDGEGGPKRYFVKRLDLTSDEFTAELCSDFSQYPYRRIFPEHSSKVDTEAMRLLAIDVRR